MTLNPGALRHRVTIQSVTRVPNGSGGYTTTWAPVGEVWAAVEPLEGRERIQAMQTDADVSHKVTMRYRAGVTAAMRVLHEGRVLDVVAPPIDHEERHQSMVLLCREL
jgi:SPP1 family predicted phage head-tail adaptor